MNWLSKKPTAIHEADIARKLLQLRHFNERVFALQRQFADLTSNMPTAGVSDSDKHARVGETTENDDDVVVFPPFPLTSFRAATTKTRVVRRVAKAF